MLDEKKYKYIKSIEKFIQYLYIMKKHDGLYVLACTSDKYDIYEITPPKTFFYAL